MSLNKASLAFLCINLSVHSALNTRQVYMRTRSPVFLINPKLSSSFLHTCRSGIPTHKRLITVTRRRTEKELHRGNITIFQHPVCHAAAGQSRPLFSGRAQALRSGRRPFQDVHPHLHRPAHPTPGTESFASRKPLLSSVRYSTEKTSLCHVIDEWPALQSSGAPQDVSSFLSRSKLVRPIWTATKWCGLLHPFFLITITGEYVANMCFKPALHVATDSTQSHHERSCHGQEPRHARPVQLLSAVPVQWQIACTMHL